jgi:hypothetical protein
VKRKALLRSIAGCPTRRKRDLLSAERGSQPQSAIGSRLAKPDEDRFDYAVEWDLSQLAHPSHDVFVRSSEQK